MVAPKITKLVEQALDEGSWTNTRQLKHRRVWHAFTNVRADKRFILTHPDIVKPNDRDDQDPYSFAVMVDAKRYRQSPLAWRVSAEYTDQWIDWDENPLKRRARIRLVYREITDETGVDYLGRPMKNTAGVDLEFPRIQAVGIWKIEKDLRTYPGPLAAMARTGAVNKDPVRIRGIRHDPKTLMVRNLEFSDLKRWGALEYLTASFELHHNPDTYFVSIKSMGLMESKEFEDDAGKKYKRPVPILIGDPGQEVPAQTLEFLDKDGVHVPRPLTAQEFKSLPLIEYDVQPPVPFRGKVPVA